MRWLFSQPEINRADLLMIIILSSVAASHAVDLWILVIIAVVWAAFSVAVEDRFFTEE